MADGPQEHQEGATSVGSYREVDTEGGADLSVLERFYRVAVQAVFLFGEETWVLSSAMANKL